MNIDLLKTKLYDEINKDFKQNKDIYMFYLSPIIFKLKTKDLNNYTYSLFSKIKHKEPTTYKNYKLNKYLKKDYEKDLKTIIKIICKSNYIDENNTYALYYIKKIISKKTNLCYINLLYRLLTNTNKIDGGMRRFLSFKPRSISRSRSISIKKPTTVTTELINNIKENFLVRCIMIFFIKHNDAYDYASLISAYNDDDINNIITIIKDITGVHFNNYNNIINYHISLLYNRTGEAIYKRECVMDIISDKNSDKISCTTDFFTIFTLTYLYDYYPIYTFNRELLDNTNTSNSVRIKDIHDYAEYINTKLFPGILNKLTSIFKTIILKLKKYKKHELRTHIYKEKRDDIIIVSKYIYLFFLSVLAYFFLTTTKSTNYNTCYNILIKNLSNYIYIIDSINYITNDNNPIKHSLVLQTISFCYNMFLHNTIILTSYNEYNIITKDTYIKIKNKLNPILERWMSVYLTLNSDNINIYTGFNNAIKTFMDNPFKEYVNINNGSIKMNNYAFINIILCKHLLLDNNIILEEELYNVILEEELYNVNGNFRYIISEYLRIYIMILTDINILTSKPEFVFKYVFDEDNSYRNIILRIQQIINNNKNDNNVILQYIDTIFNDIAEVAPEAEVAEVAAVAAAKVAEAEVAEAKVAEAEVAAAKVAAAKVASTIIIPERAFNFEILRKTFSNNGGNNSKIQNDKLELLLSNIFKHIKIIGY